MTVILFLLILAALVFFHELGHFTAAKIFGIHVDEFAIGFPPKLFSWKKGETNYVINLIPFGGYVKIFGENPDPSESPSLSADSLRASESSNMSSRSFQTASKWKQVMILLSGIFMNIVFAWVLVSISFNIGISTLVDDQYQNDATNKSVVILSVLKDSPAEKSGLKEGDEIEKIQSQKITDIGQVQEIVLNNSKLNIEYKRDTATGSAKVIVSNNLLEGKRGIGVAMGTLGTVRFGFPRSYYEGAKLTGIETENMAIGIYEFIKSAFIGQADLSQVSGPIGIVKMVGQASAMGISYLLGFIAIISINLAILNAIPFPALDGGRVLFVLIEVVIRRKIKPIILNWANGIGFGLLIILMVAITFKDIVKLIN